MGHYLVAILILPLAFASSCITPKVPKSSAFRLPSRSIRAPTGTAFIRSTRIMTLEQREKAITKELTSGNLPRFLGRLQIVSLSARTLSRKLIRGRIWVMPDYLSVGSDRDFVRTPMTPVSAQKVADRLGFVLPTRKLVNEIYRHARIKLRPRPMRPGPAMTSSNYYETHNRTIQAQLRYKRITSLVAGHKKDIVVTNLLRKRPKRVAIYGWHRSVNSPIQPLSLVHGDSYADYSHGVRLIFRIMEVEGKAYYVKDVLRHPDHSRLISDEGTIYNYRLLSSAYKLEDSLPSSLTRDASFPSAKISFIE